MENIFNFSKTALLNLWQAKSNHPARFGAILLLCSVPLSLALGNIAFMFFALVCLLQFRKHLFFRIDPPLLVSVALYVLMAVSLIWSIDPAKSLNALSKELTLFAIPVCFMLIPPFTRSQKTSILQAYAYFMAGLSVFYLLRATVRFFTSGDASFFFYHGLVSLEVNAIHVSVYVAVAFFVLLSVKGKTPIDKLSLSVLLVILVLLSSKNIILVFVGLSVVYFFGSGNIGKSHKLVASGLIAIGVLAIVLIPKIADRFLIEYQTATTDDSINTDLSTDGHKVFNASIKQAWEKDTFGPDYFFSGTAFRVYQLRIFCEMLHEDPIFWKGYGLNASMSKIAEKVDEHDLFKGSETIQGYQHKNFHNQYVQNFAELGIVGLILLLMLLIVSLVLAIRNKDFVHISFTVLMISLFLTESFLWRQRGAMYFAAMYCLLNAGSLSLAAGKGKKL